VKRALLALPALVLAACGSDRLAGNNGTSTDNVITTAINIDSAAFGLERPDTGAYPLLLRLTASRIDFDRTLPDGGDLRVQLDDSSAVPFLVREWNRGERYGSVWVRLPRGTVWKSRGLRLFHGGGVRFGLSDSASTFNGVSPRLQRNLTSTLLADFEQDTLRALLPCDCNDWYGGNSLYATRWLPAYGKRIETAVETDSLGPRSRVMHLSWSGASGAEWALVGTRLGTRIQRFALLDSITFRARGNGLMRVALEDGRDTSDRSKAWAPVQLTANWRNITIRPTDFDTADPQFSSGWESVKNRVNTFTVFGIGVGTDLWIDDIRFHGIGAAELQ